jgi:hypothetical protein
MTSDVLHILPFRLEKLLTAALASTSEKPYPKSAGSTAGFEYAEIERLRGIHDSA